MNFLTSGTGGCIFINDNRIIKFSHNTENIKKEFINIKLLPYNDFYYNIEEVKISRVTNDEYNIIVNECKSLSKKFIKMKDNFLLKLEMPMINGITLESILIFYKSTWAPKSTNIIDIDLFINILKAYSILFIGIINLNITYNIYHNDLNNRNIIYDNDKNKFMIIDFEAITFDIDEYGENNKDISNLNIHLKEIINMGAYNKQINEWIIQNNIRHISLEDIITKLL
jgi:hypothetical protein